MNKLRTILFGVVLTALSASGQSFINLDFEGAAQDAGLNSTTKFVSYGLAFPGWSQFNSGDLFAGHGEFPTDSVPFIYLVDQYSTNLAPLGGGFSAALVTGKLNGGVASPFLYQTATIPANTTSLNFQALGNIVVLVNGVAQPEVPLGGNLLGCDFSKFAGQTCTLEFANGSSALHNAAVVDNITFQTQIVPEPATPVLLGVGFIGLALRHYFRRGP